LGDGVHGPGHRLREDQPLQRRAAHPHRREGGQARHGGDRVSAHTTRKPTRCTGWALGATLLFLTTGALATPPAPAPREAQPGPIPAPRLAARSVPVSVSDNQE